MQNQQVTTTIGDITIAVHGESADATICGLRETQNYHWCADDCEATLGTSVNMYGAAVAADGNIVNNEEYVAFKDDDYETVS